MSHVLEILLLVFVDILDVSRDGNKGTKDVPPRVFRLRDWLDNGTTY